MAKPRKARINKINNRDRLANELMSKGGLIPKDELLKIITSTRLEAWCHDRYWEKLSHTTNNNERMEGYRLTVEGRRYVEKTWGYSNHTDTKQSSIMHDLKVGSIASSIENKESIESETDMWRKYHAIMEDKQKELDELEQKRLDQHLSIKERDEYSKLWVEKQNEYDRIVELRATGGISAPDLGYTTETGEYVVYEVTTASYGTAERAAKEEFAKLLGARIEFVRA